MHTSTAPGWMLGLESLQSRWHSDQPSPSASVSSQKKKARDEDRMFAASTGSANSGEKGVGQNMVRKVGVCVRTTPNSQTAPETAKVPTASKSGAMESGYATMPTAPKS